MGETREEGNQGFDKSTNFIVIIIIILMMLIILLMVMMKKKIRVEPAEVLPCCRPLQAARFLLLSAFSISSWWLIRDDNYDGGDDADGHLLFWYHVLTWVSVKPSFAASSIRS